MVGFAMKISKIQNEDQAIRQRYSRQLYNPRSSIHELRFLELNIVFDHHYHHTQEITECFVHLECLVNIFKSLRGHHFLPLHISSCEFLNHCSDSTKIFDNNLKNIVYFNLFMTRTKVCDHFWLTDSYRNFANLSLLSHNEFETQLRSFNCTLSPIVRLDIVLAICEVCEKFSMAKMHAQFFPNNRSQTK